MSTNRSAGPGVPTQETPRSAATSKVGRLTATKKKDRSTNLCAFTFADGRQCRTPRCSGHLHLCYFHAQKEAERLAANQVGEDISRFLPAKLLTACDLGAAMARVFCAIARGDVKPKVASTLAYLSQSMVQSIPIAQHEYSEAFGSDAWRREVRASFNVPAQPKPAPQPAPKPAPPATSFEPKPAPQPTPQLASQPAPPKPAPLPHKPLPPTSAEFAQQVLAGRNSSRSQIPTPSAPARENGSSEQPAPSSPCTLPTPDNSQPAPTPPAPESTSPQQSQPTHNSQHNSQPAPAPPAPPSVPPGFGAPANWDVLIPPKPRRRFSRLP